MTTAESKTSLFVDELQEKRESSHPFDIMYEAQDRCREVGFDFDNIDLVLGKVDEEIEEMKEAFANRDENPGAFEDEIGDCFFSLVNLCRHAKVDMGKVLDDNCSKYLQRCAYIEGYLKAEGKEWQDLELKQIYQLWKEAKQ